MPGAAERAELLRKLHRRKPLFILPNAWDVPSARVFEDAGFPAVATSSAGLMVSLGFPDGESIPIPTFVAAVRRISHVLSVPLSADIVGGFGRTPRAVVRLARKVIAAGAVGFNIEDLDTGSGKLYPVAGQVAKIKALRSLGDSVGVPVVINGRTDAYRHAPGSPDARLREAIGRAEKYRDAGADCVYPMGLADATSIRTFVKALAWPTNVMIRPGLPPVAQLERMGVARLSFGPSASYATMGLMKRASRELLEKGTFRTLTDGAISFDELNRLSQPRR